MHLCTNNCLPKQRNERIFSGRLFFVCCWLNRKMNTIFIYCTGNMGSFLSPFRFKPQTSLRPYKHYVHCTAQLLQLQHICVCGEQWTNSEESSCCGVWFEDCRTMNKLNGNVNNNNNKSSNGNGEKMAYFTT